MNRVERTANASLHNSTSQILMGNIAGPSQLCNFCRNSVSKRGITDLEHSLPGSARFAVPPGCLQTFKHVKPLILHATCLAYQTTLV